MELASLALPMLAILAVQTVAMALYAIFVTYRMMGKNYDAAVLAAGHCGFWSQGDADGDCQMQAITERFGPSHMAFLVVPMVGAFFIDIVNALVIKLYLLLPILAESRRLSGPGALTAFACPGRIVIYVTGDANFCDPKSHWGCRIKVCRPVSVAPSGHPVVAVLVFFHASARFHRFSSRCGGSYAR